MDSKSRYTLRTDPVLLEKLGYIAEYEGRTKNRELEQMIKRRIAAFEQEHGEIPIEESDRGCGRFFIKSSPERRRAQQCRRDAPQSAAEEASLARYGVRAVDRWIETQWLVAQPRTPHLHCAARAALQAANPQCKFSLGGSKGGISLFEKRYPSLVRAAPAGAAFPPTPS